MTESFTEQQNDLRQRAMRWLAAREYSRAELLRKLKHHCADESLLEGLLDELQQTGWQSDQRFAESFVRGRLRKGQGRVRIQQELRQRGVAAELIAAALEEEAVDWLALGRQQYVKRFGEEAPSESKDYAKRLRFLLYRGFTQDQARAIIAGAKESAGG